MRILFLIFLFSCTKNIPQKNPRIIIEENCIGCHSLKLVEQNFMSRMEWDKTLIWMEKKHNLPKFDAETRKEILDYLGEFQSTRHKKRIDRPVNPLPENI